VTTTKKKGRARSALGRPPLPPEERATRRITVRLYADDDALLAQLCEQLEATEGEVIRRALQQLARRLRVSR
jgi:hypothetical protein